MYIYIYVCVCVNFSRSFKPVYVNSHNKNSNNYTCCVDKASYIINCY